MAMTSFNVEDSLKDVLCGLKNVVDRLRNELDEMKIQMKKNHEEIVDRLDRLEHETKEVLIEVREESDGKKNLRKRKISKEGERRKESVAKRRPDVQKSTPAMSTGEVIEICDEISIKPKDEGDKLVFSFPFQLSFDEIKAITTEIKCVGKIEEETKSSLREITREMVDSCKDKIQIKDRDLARLDTNIWFNDILIDFWSEW